uniref:Uncharacterized protein n=4 Tax=Aplanochytrium stocchinoi TaxID=215587 RepID=A0A7S3PEH8_9STRA|mmetsp:Transcript_18182/g.22431  ORF Transcript_18182/g.22431 Transcript_18182/m.22431 type:complete len:305 (+) Transcript_18182:76-990(+)
MGVRAALSKVCLYVIIGYHTMHGLFMMEGNLVMEKAWNTKNNGLGYFGDELAVQYILFILRIGGIAEVLFSLGALIIGDTKMCFSLLAIGTYGATASFSRDVSAMVTLAKLNQVHQENVSNERFVFFGALIVNYIGLICASGKQKDEKLVRSKSGFVNHILILSMFIEVAVWGYVLLDTVGNFVQLQPTMDMKMFEKSFTTEGEWMFATLTGIFVANMFTLAAIVITLKPTSKAVMLSMLFHGVVAAFLFVLKLNSDETVKDSASRENIEAFAIQGVITHVVLAALLFGCLIIDGRTREKSKAE